MNVLRWKAAFAAAAALGFASGSAVFAGPIGLVDDFNTPGLTEYTQTRVLDNGVATANVSFSDATGNLVASYGGTPNSPEQVVLLRDDYTLGIGEKLVVDVAQATSTVEMDFGIAISATESPTSASAGDTDTRDTFSWLAVYVRPSQNAVRVTSANNAAPVTASFVRAADETTVRNLFIQRLTATTFNVGYIDTNGIHHTTNVDNMNMITPISFTATNVGDAVGFYADLRSAGTAGTSLGPPDNLRIVPEPAAALLALAGCLGIGFLRRRSKN
jgi:hypothetical protein